MADHLNSLRRAANATGASLFGKTGHFSSSIFQITYSQSEHLTSPLYQAELLEEAGNLNLNPSAWDKICMTTDIKPPHFHLGLWSYHEPGSGGREASLVKLVHLD